MKTVIEMAKEAGLVGGPVYARGLERFAELVRADALAQPEERNFCPRCGKRLASGFVEISIHTCTPPKENT